MIFVLQLPCIIDRFNTVLTNMRNGLALNLSNFHLQKKAAQFMLRNNFVLNFVFCHYANGRSSADQEKAINSCM